MPFEVKVSTSPARSPALPCHPRSREFPRQRARPVRRGHSCTAGSPRQQAEGNAGTVRGQGGPVLDNAPSGGVRHFRGGSTRTSRRRLGQHPTLSQGMRSTRSPSGHPRARALLLEARTRLESQHAASARKIEEHLQNSAMAAEIRSGLGQAFDGLIPRYRAEAETYLGTLRHHGPTTWDRMKRRVQDHVILVVFLSVLAVLAAMATAVASIDSLRGFVKGLLE
jgi:hypothetical protein